MKRNVIDIITLGCSKNLVDSERLMGMLEYVGFECTHDSEQPEGEIAIINTCGFIGDAKEESINTILEFVNRKNNGLLKKIYVMGCLSQRYKEELEKEIPEVDKFYGKFDVKTLVSDLCKSSIPSCDGCRHSLPYVHCRRGRVSVRVRSDVSQDSSLRMAFLAGQ